MKSHYIVLALASLTFLLCLPVSQSCNKALCASDVSKCLIQVRIQGTFVNTETYCVQVDTIGIYQSRYTHRLSSGPGSAVPNFVFYLYGYLPSDQNWFKKFNLQYASLLYKLLWVMSVLLSTI